MSRLNISKFALITIAYQKELQLQFNLCSAAVTSSFGSQGVTDRELDLAKILLFCLMLAEYYYSLQR